MILVLQLAILGLMIWADAGKVTLMACAFCAGGSFVLDLLTWLRSR